MWRCTNSSTYLLKATTANRRRGLWRDLDFTVYTLLNMDVCPSIEQTLAALETSDDARQTDRPSAQLRSPEARSSYQGIAFRDYIHTFEDHFESLMEKNRGLVPGAPPFSFRATAISIAKKSRDRMDDQQDSLLSTFLYHKRHTSTTPLPNLTRGAF